VGTRAFNALPQTVDTRKVADLDPLESTFYYQPMVRLYLRGYGVLGFIIWVCLTFGPHIFVIFRLLIAVGSFAFLYWSWRLGGRGLEARPDGIRFRRGLRWHFIPWREIRAFSIHRRSFSPTVYVDLASGESRIMPFTQGRTTRWKGGNTRDTVAVLNTKRAHAVTSGSTVRTV
jgi:hypothetical protein